MDPTALVAALLSWGSPRSDKDHQLPTLVQLQRVAAAPSGVHAAPPPEVRGAPVADSPGAAVKAGLEQILSALAQPTAVRLRAVRQVVDTMFDWPELARRTLPPEQWKALTGAQQEEFVRLFADLLERTYVKQINQYSGEPIQVKGERMDPDGEAATVNTMLMTQKQQEVRIDYRLHKLDGRWRVYDVNVMGLSLVSNFRTQFRRIIPQSSFGELLLRLRAKQQL